MIAPDQRAALITLRDCGAVRARKQIRRFFGLVLIGLAECAERVCRGEKWLVYRLTDAGKAALDGDA